MIKLDQFKVKKIEEDDSHGIFEIGPLPKGYGYTLANSLRRLLLSSIPGAAVTGIKIDGVKHEYSTIDGVQDDIITIMLRLKELSIAIHTEEPQTLKLTVKGKKGALTKVTAADIDLPGEVEIINPDLEITTLTKDVTLSIEIYVEQGVAYAYPDEGKRKEIGVIPVDSIFSPVKRVQVDIAQARFGQFTNLDQINLEIFTNGTIKPSAALLKSAEIFDELANRLVNLLGGDSEFAEKMLEQEQVKEKKEEKILIGDLNLSTRLTNALLNAGITDLRDLQGKNKDDVSSFRGMGKKSMSELEAIMKEHELNFA